jgi:hypothetical protein
MMSEDTMFPFIGECCIFFVSDPEMLEVVA